MLAIPESELVINERGAVYHLNLLPEELAPVVITVGDPSRVAQVSSHLDKIELKRQHREFVTHTGTLGKKRISIISTGIGTDNIDIVLNELDALVNIDLNERKIKQQFGRLNLIRIGTCGSLRSSVAVDSFVVSTHAIGLDNLLNFYTNINNEEEKNILQHFNACTQINESVSPPYIAGGSAFLLKHFVEGFHHGITVTCPGFYGPQGRVLRLGLANPELMKSIAQFEYGNHRILNFEMETSGIYALGKLLGHHCLSVSAVVNNRISGKFTNDVNAVVDRLIERTLDILESINT